MRGAKAACAQLLSSRLGPIQDDLDRSRHILGILRTADGAKRTVRVVKHDAVHLREVADHDRQTSGQALEQLVRGRHPVVPR